MDGLMGSAKRGQMAMWMHQHNQSLSSPSWSYILLACMVKLQGACVPKFSPQSPSLPDLGGNDRGYGDSTVLIV